MDYIVNGKLYHHGIKGQKKGERRWQNPDGSLTPAGVERYRKMDQKRRESERRNIKSGNRAKDTEFARKMMVEENRHLKTQAEYDKLTKEKTNLEKSKDVVDSTSNAVRELKNLERSIPKSNKKNTMDLSNMTDQEMRSQINRALLEKQYNNMFAPQKTNKGREYCRTALEVGGAVLAVGASALSIAVAIKELKS